MLLLAGNTLAFTVWNLARCPDKAAKLCAEIDAAPGKATFESIDHLPYMDAVLRESLRLFPPLPVALRDAAEDQLIGGASLTSTQCPSGLRWRSAGCTLLLPSVQTPAFSFSLCTCSLRTGVAWPPDTAKEDEEAP